MSRAMVPTKMRPTLPLGTPYVPPQMGAAPPVTIPEPVDVVGKSGKKYIQAGDNPNGPEAVSVTPPGGAPETAMAGALPQGDEGFWDHVHRLWQGNTPKAVVPTQAPAPGEMSAANGTYDPMADEQQRQAAVYAAQTAGVDARTQKLSADAGVTNATAGTFAPTAALIQANRQANAAADVQNNASRGMIQTQQADTATRTSEEQQRQAAANNVQDLQAVAQAKTYRADQQVKNQQAGVSAAEEYVQPEGSTAKAPAGTLAKIQTQGEVLGTKFAARDKLSALQIEQLKNAVDLEGTNATAAKNAAERLGFTLDEAKLRVAQAQNASSVAGLGVSAADNNTSRATIIANEAKLTDPTKVVYQDPVTGTSRLVSPAEKQTLEAQNTRDFNLTTPGTVLYTDPDTGVKSYKTQAEADQLRHDYEQRKGLSNATADANYNTARQPAQDAAQTALDIQYSNDPNHAPVSWLLQNMQKDTPGAPGSSSAPGPNAPTASGQGVLSRSQVMGALIAQGYSYDQAKGLTESNATGSGTQITMPAGTGFGH